MCRIQREAKNEVKERILKEKTVKPAVLDSVQASKP